MEVSPRFLMLSEETGYDDGEMYVDGEPTFQYDDADWEEYRRRKSGYIFQDTVL